MIEFVSEVLVKEEAKGRFELAFGPGGMWSKLFARSLGFRGTTLLRDMKNQRRYLTIDLWDSEAQHEQALNENKSEYDELETAFEEWVELKTELGTFRVQAEATVHPIKRAQRSRGGETRRRNRRKSR
jgi:heme-degrading monooxygenase HmoA